MKAKLLASLFPPPKYLEMPLVGLDISDRSVKYAEILLRRGKPKLGRIGEADIPLGAIVSGQIKEAAVLRDVLKKLRGNDEAWNIAASLPEEQSYAVRMKLPAMDPGEIRQSIEFKLEEHVPLPPSEAVFDYEAVSEENALDAAVSVLPRATVSAYTAIFKESGLEPLALEIESQALVRALVQTGDRRTVLIVDVGKSRTGFTVASGGRVLLSSTISNIGGEDITRSVQKNLGVSYEEAERLKIERGLLRSEGEKELFYALVPVVATLRDEIGKIVSYWSVHRDEAGLSRPKIEHILLCGGQSTLPGMVEYVGSNFDLPVRIGNPWANVMSFREEIPPVGHNAALRYTTAIGLALRNTQKL